MDMKNSGGPAFPTLAVVGDAALSDGGLTVRDYFAANCPITIKEAVDIANGLEVPFDTDRDLDGLLRFYADLRVRYADAMLAVRASSAQSSAEAESAAPDSDGWIEWSGGECPVAGDTLVEVVLRYGESVTDRASAFTWWHIGLAYDIVRYRVVSERGAE